MRAPYRVYTDSVPRCRTRNYQDEIAKQTGVSNTTISELVTGKRTALTMETARRVACVLC
ncbi:helix-turn-helix domain-containing protein [Alicyclobacillus fastidiosus]|uniref:helix-turn-helix domain-containing protein n=1 Tax=Alicyclobacillus fastidiosus TaxID=392011 RepID=UPI0034D7A068